MDLTLDNGITLSTAQQNKVINEVRVMGMVEEAEMLKEGSLWDEERLLNIVEDMDDEGKL